MRIISGSLKGRVIPTIKSQDYRPTLSRIREDIFNLIEHNKKLNVNLQRSTFGDLFCGTGSIGAEALSRGAQKVIFNDISNQNIEKKFSFNNFIEAFSFMTQVALLCEKYNHHPNWDNVYSCVNILFTTHDLGGISNLDQILASEINKLIDN